MARFYGVIGFEKEQVEKEPGIYEPAQYEERLYMGNVLRHLRKWDQSSDSTNDNLVLSNRISIVSDAYMNDHWPAIKYAVWYGEKWKVDSVEIARPRIILNIGGPWHGNTD